MTITINDVYTPEVRAKIAEIHAFWEDKGTPHWEHYAYESETAYIESLPTYKALEKQRELESINEH